MPTIPEQAITPRQLCYLCQSSTRSACARCKRPICIDHTKTHLQMHWESWRAGGARASTRWTRYMPNGALLKVCPACDATLNAEEAPERARDRVLVRNTAIGNLMPLFVAVAIFAVPFLLGHFVCH